MKTRTKTNTPKKAFAFNSGFKITKLAAAICLPMMLVACKSGLPSEEEVLNSVEDFTQVAEQRVGEDLVSDFVVDTERQTQNYNPASANTLSQSDFRSMDQIVVQSLNSDSDQWREDYLNSAELTMRDAMGDNFPEATYQ